MWAYIGLWLRICASPPFLSVSDCPGRINLPHLLGIGRPPKDRMNSDSHKAMRNSFAHHRAALLLTRPELQVIAPHEAPATKISFQERKFASRSLVAAGLHGLVSAPAAFA